MKHTENPNFPHLNAAMRMSKEEIKAKQDRYNESVTRSSTPEQAQQFKVLALVVSCIVVAGLILNSL